MRMKKTCAGCRASSENSCQLGYRFKQVHGEKTFLGVHIENKPLEPCPKPKTLKDLQMQWEIQEKEGRCHENT